MNELERELLQTLKNFVTQYDLDKQQQQKQINNLVEEIQSLKSTISGLNRQINNLETAYQDMMNVLEE